MHEKCDRPIFGKGLIPSGYCGLQKGHDGFPEKCAILVETIPEHERSITKQLDLDLSDAWKPNRDLPNGEVWIGPDGDVLPDHLIPDEL